MRKLPDIKATDAQGRPMANSGGLRRQRKKLRKQIKVVLNTQSGVFDTCG